MWHHWKVYSAETSGDLRRSEDETKRANWYSKEDIKKLAQRTEQYNAKQISEEEWEKSPGLEPVMYEWFKELNVI